MIPEDKDKASLVTTETDLHGAFCFKAKSGTYNVQVRKSFIVGLSCVLQDFQVLEGMLERLVLLCLGFTVNFHYF